MAVREDYDAHPQPRLVIRGGIALEGEVALPGAKNAALPALVAACASDEDVLLGNVPTDLNDVRLLIDFLRELGADVEEVGDRMVRCSGRHWRGGDLVDERAGQLRHSLLLLGLAASRGTPLALPMPGGCKLGERKHDLHILALSALGHQVSEAPEGLHFQPGAAVEDADFRFHYPTFGGTLNALIAAATLEGRTTWIRNAAKNPEVADIITLLASMGARIRWVSSDTLEVRGVRRLGGTEHTVMSDRIVAATVIAATAVTQGHSFAKNANGEVLRAEIDVWRRAGLEVRVAPEGIETRFVDRMQSTDIETRAYPGFHTDIQPLHAIMMVFAHGTSTIRETILDGRFRYARELDRLGARTSVGDGGFTCVNGAPGQILTIEGVQRLVGTDVIATDIRGGASVAVAALAAEGTTSIGNLYQLERGYGRFDALFSNLGADLRMVEAPAAAPAR